MGAGHDERWARLTRAVPWLALVGEPAGLDLDELVEPAGTVAEVRAEVERALAAHVMTYRAGSSATGGRQLCRLLAPAVLTPHALATLQAAEDRLDGVVLCAYTRPLVWRQS